jgi:hypothetical protein
MSPLILFRPDAGCKFEWGLRGEWYSFDIKRVIRNIINRQLIDKSLLMVL